MPTQPLDQRDHQASGQGSLQPLSTFHRLLRILSLTSFTLLLLLVCYLLMFRVEQTKDIVLQVNTLDNVCHYLGFLLALLWFSAMAWWSARYLINIAFTLIAIGFYAAKMQVQNAIRCSLTTVASLVFGCPECTPWYRRFW